MKWRPSPAEERWLTLARELRATPAAAQIAPHSGGWQTLAPASRLIFCVLGLIAALTATALLSLLHLRLPYLVAGSAALLTAEWLIVGRRNFWSGLEEALWSAGALLIALQLVHQGEPERAVVGTLSAVLAAAGLRLLNPLPVALAALGAAYALDLSHRATGFSCFGLALLALAAGSRHFRRPAYDLMLDWLVVVLPVAGYLWSSSALSDGGAVDYRHAGLTAWLVPLLPLGFALIAAFIGIRRRTHAPLCAALVCLACCAWELRALTGLALELRLIVWGALLLLAGAALERYLRTPRAGITSLPGPSGDELADLLTTAGAAVLTPHAPPGTRAFEGAGGRFGGGGASGEY